jgi:ribonuclease HII
MYWHESRARNRGYHSIAGIDEAGRGPLAGPVVAAAVIMPPGYRHSQINDSKKLSPKKREMLYEAIRRDAVSIGVGVSEVQVIDTINILQATILAMKEAVLGFSVKPDYLLIDGLNRIDVDLPQETIVRGDQKSISIAAASIIAKVSRDRLMDMYHRQFPMYNFIRNKGYGTREHLNAISQYGRCKLHRRSFHVAGLDDLETEKAGFQSKNLFPRGK